MLKLILTTDQPEFSVTTPDGEAVHIRFLNAPIDLSYGQLEDAATFLASDGVWCTVFMEDSSIVAVLTREYDMPIDLSLAITPGTPEDVGVSCVVQGGSLKKDADSDNLWNLRISDMELRFVLADKNSVGGVSDVHPAAQSVVSPTFSTLATGDPYQVGAYERWPEWAVSIFDYMDTTGTLHRPRPIRYGVPVISTVAVDGDWTKVTKTDYQGTTVDNMETQEKFDIEQVRTGRPAPYRRMYFLCVCDNDIIDQSPFLLVYLPSGIDTVRFVPVYIALQKYKANSKQWWCYYDFHQEDGLEYVDGYCYLSVYIPMTVVRPLPLRLRYKTTGFSSGDDGLDDPYVVQEDATADDAVSLLSVNPSEPNQITIKVGIKDAGPKYQNLPPAPINLGGCGC